MGFRASGLGFRVTGTPLVKVGPFSLVSTDVHTPTSIKNRLFTLTENDSEDPRHLRRSDVVCLPFFKLRAPGILNLITLKV